MILKNLWRRGTRSLLTLHGIATGVAAVVALGSIGNGIANNYGGALGLNNELIVSQAGALDVLMGGLDEKLAERIATIPDVTNVDPGVFTFINVEGSPFFLIYGYPPNSAATQHYRIVDFRRNKDGIPAKVERLEYDPNRTANLALLCYADGERRYIIAPKGVAAGAQLISGSEAPIKPGNALPIRNIPVGTTIHCIEMVPGKGAQIARAAGTSVQLMAREGSYAQLRLRSGEIRRVHIECRATIGEVGNEEHSLRSIGKAGAQRWRGIRPTVRGVVMNPVDHPHGGGEGRTAAGMHPVSPWGVKTKGYRTRRNKRTSSMIVQRRPRNKR